MKNEHSKLIHKLQNLFLNLFAPRNCVGCQKINEVLCKNCLNSSYKFGGACVFCNFRNNTGKICQQCLPVRSGIDRMLWVGEYKNALKNAIQELKYKKRKELTKPLAELLYKKFREYYPKYKMENFRVIPIPMHPQKEQARGFNQAKLLAKEFGKISNIEVLSDFLLKTENTLSQVETKTKEERMKNLEGAFKKAPLLNKEGVMRGKTIILIDDVATTGATFLHASRALGDEVKIICLAIAHGY